MFCDFSVPLLNRLCSFVFDGMPTVAVHRLTSKTNISTSVGFNKSFWAINSRSGYSIDLAPFETQTKDMLKWRNSFGDQYSFLTAVIVQFVADLTLQPEWRLCDYELQKVGHSIRDCCAVPCLPELRNYNHL